MAKQGEIDYLENLGEAGIRHAVNKPFSDDFCSRHLMEIGAIMCLLPPPPATLLDLGCGTGWTSLFFARRGYQVVGIDISSDMIYWANQGRESAGLDNVEFGQCDYEDLAYRDEFDVVVFYDSLHHAVDESLAMRKAYQALKTGGVCLASEPGTGHQDSSAALEAVAAYNVTEKDMPPEKIAALGRAAGFSRVQVYPHAYELAQWFFPGETAGKPENQARPFKPGDATFWSDPQVVPALAARAAGGGLLRRALDGAKRRLRLLAAGRDSNRGFFGRVAESQCVGELSGRLRTIRHQGLVRLTK